MSAARKVPWLKWLKIVGLFFLSFFVIIILIGVIANESMPKGTPGPEADQLAREVMASVNIEAWDSTGAVAWNFGGRNEHLWDRERNLAKIRWGAFTTLIDLNTQRGIAYINDRPVPGEGDKLIQDGWKHWVNDSFWLNPLAKLFDEGTTREIVAWKDGSQALLIKYSQGGVTPGDAYLWILDENKRPRAWKMWVSIIPIGGIGLSWDQWQQLPTGAWISTFHKGALPLPLTLNQVSGAATLEELHPGPDPFAPLLQP